MIANIPLRQAAIGLVRGIIDIGYLVLRAAASSRSVHSPTIPRRKLIRLPKRRNSAGNMASSRLMYRTSSPATLSPIPLTMPVCRTMPVAIQCHRHRLGRVASRSDRPTTTSRRRPRYPQSRTMPLICKSTRCRPTPTPGGDRTGPMSSSHGRVPI